MWLFIWKKYEDSWLATAISFVGNILVAIAAIAAAMGLTRLIGGNAGDVLAIVVGIALYIALRILLNRMTDRVAEAHLQGSANRILARAKKRDEESKSRDAALLDAMANETDQDRLYKAVKESMTSKVGWYSAITREQSLSGARRLDDAHLMKLIEWYRGYGFNRAIQKQRQKAGEPLNGPAQKMLQLVECVQDPGRQDALKKQLYLD